MAEKLKVISPYNLDLIEEIPMHTASDVEKTITKAKAIFDDRSKWIPKHERVQILERAKDIMSNQIEELTIVAAEEGGKPYVDSEVEVKRAINGLQIAIEEIGHFAGEEIPMGQNASSTNRMAFTRKEPIGVVSSISAFNG